jgi:hypothetical protein
MNAKASTAPGMSGVNAGKGSTAISLIALAWHLGNHSYQAGNPGYSEPEQAWPAFAVLAVVVATAAAIALASRAGAGAGTSGAAEGGRSVGCRPLRDT